MYKSARNIDNVLVSANFAELGTPPVVISLSEAKTYARIDSGDDDALIQVMIDGSIEAFEQYTSRVVNPATMSLVYESFGSSISIPYAPIGLVQKIEYSINGGDRVDVTNDWEVLGGDVKTIYAPEVYSGGRLYVEALVGYGTSFPEGAKLGCLKWIASQYEDRQDNVGGTIVAKLPNDSASLWRKYRVMSL